MSSFPPIAIVIKPGLPVVIQAKMKQKAVMQSLRLYLFQSYCRFKESKYLNVLKSCWHILHLVVMINHRP